MYFVSVMRRTYAMVASPPQVEELGTLGNVGLAVEIFTLRGVASEPLEYVRRMLQHESCAFLLALMIVSTRLTDLCISETPGMAAAGKSFDGPSWPL